MATENTTKKEEKVDLFIPKGYANDEPNFFISVNGKNFILPKGKTSLVPPAIAEEIRRSQAEENKFFEEMEARGIKPENARFM